MTIQYCEDFETIQDRYQTITGVINERGFEFYFTIDRFQIQIN